VVRHDRRAGLRHNPARTISTRRPPDARRGGLMPCWAPGERRRALVIVSLKGPLAWSRHKREGCLFARAIASRLAGEGHLSRSGRVFLSEPVARMVSGVRVSAFFTQKAVTGTAKL
jgi:hypothetical protein